MTLIATHYPSVEDRQVIGCPSPEHITLATTLDPRALPKRLQDKFAPTPMTASVPVTSPQATVEASSPVAPSIPVPETNLPVPAQPSPAPETSSSVADPVVEAPGAGPDPSATVKTEAVSETATETATETPSVVPEPDVSLESSNGLKGEM